MFKVFRRKSSLPEESLHQVFRYKYEAFLKLLKANNSVLELMADMEEKTSGDYLFDRNYIHERVQSISNGVSTIIRHLNTLSGNKYEALAPVCESILRQIDQVIKQRVEIPQADYVIPLEKVTADMGLIAGGKMANVGEMKNRLGLPVPDGFVITTSAFKCFLDLHGIRERLHELMTNLDLKDLNAVQSAGDAFRKLITEAPLPPEIEDAIRAALGSMSEREDADSTVSVRSSALSEDGHFSFAGQYSTFLNVKPEDVPARYREVVSSLFTPRALYYAASKGFVESEMVMAVGVMRMVPALAGGVLYTQDPTAPESEMMVINGAWGLAKLVVDGLGKTDRFHVSRDTGAVTEQIVGEKRGMITSEAGGGVGETMVSDEKVLSPCLDERQIRTLAGLGLSLEEHYAKPQDIEWTVDSSGDIRLLQTRPLQVHEQAPKKALQRRFNEYPLLIERGVIASRGVGCGRVFLVTDDTRLEDFPDGGVLVARATSTKYVTVMDRASAIVTDVGGATGHMASLAREYRLPAILDTDVATQILQDGMEVTVDAINCNVYGGRVEPLIEYAESRRQSLKETALFNELDQVMKFIVPLRLVDPESEMFRPESCTTLHDITRFSHEKAISGMFGISDTDEMEDEATISLSAGIPMQAHMIDVGGGMREDVKKAKPEDILSVPYIAFLKGLKAMKWPEPRTADVKGFMGMMAHAASITEEQLQQTAIRSFAVVSSHYMNFSIRLGYHFSMVEAFAGETLNDNYIRFFFKGGGAAGDRRLRRVRLISEILRKMDFRVKVVEDVIDAVLLKFRQSAIEQRLEIMGRLTVYTKQLDMAMFNDDITDWYRDEFVRDHMDITDSSAG